MRISSPLESRLQQFATRVGIVVASWAMLVSLAFAGPVAGRVVCIDAGHQARSNNSQEPVGPGATETKACVTSGTSGAVSGPESGVNLDVALRLHDILTSNGVIVIMTRTTQAVDLCNSERSAIANRARADLFMRIHCDAGSQHNCFTLYPGVIPGWTDDIAEESKKAAGFVQAAFAKHTGLPDAGILPRTDLSGFNYSDVTSVLTEMLHMQNAADDQLAASPAVRQIMAEGLAIGALDYLRTLPEPATSRGLKVR